MRVSLKYYTGSTFQISNPTPSLVAWASGEFVCLESDEGNCGAFKLHCNRKEAHIIAHSLLLALAESEGES